MIVFTFPGQGSQKPGMGEAWRDHPSWELVDEASSVAERDLARLLLEADADELKATHNAQLATFLTSLVVLDAVERVGVEPAATAGHSLGEYTALVASGALSLDDGVRLVAERGEAMLEAATTQTGTMAAVLGLDDGDVEIACARVDGDVWVANYNAPGQVVVAGSPDAVAEAADVAKAMGAKKVMPMAVSGAFHTPFMAPARERLRKAVGAAELRAPDVPVYANVDALAHGDGDEWPGLLGAQLCSPVRWRQSLHHLADAGATVFVELGPGNVLTGMAKRTVSGATTLSVSVPDDLDKLLATLATPSAASAGVHEGEHLFATERVVVSPAAGVFAPAADVDAGTEVTPGSVLGLVGDQEVRSPFAGTVMGMLAVDGERVSVSQPIAWLRTS
ncbi:ACP S-malonyltransferase [Rhabdothermincola salaria]|uniref:ACP S-malonyltransferase n=1 Tax=Rhabdothermincola salaria TaxID=2903142 RepID=UPI001E5A7A4B|nr:ACP S-malonyltransferase [Rhabdothermincola salaria]MCD9622560.1 ACP S-malonyltransferase [Rhabdothermincola salaria]